MIERLELKDFTAFSDLGIDFSPRVNVIIGENGTGKTHLMKAAYAMCLGSYWLANESGANSREITLALTQKLIRLFSPLDNKLGKVRRRGAGGNAELTGHFPIDRVISINFHSNSKLISLQDNVENERIREAPIFIPTKEVLTLVQGISAPHSDPITIQSLFDDTYIDLCGLLLSDSSSDAAERLELDPRFGSVFPEMVHAIGGKYEFVAGRFYFHQGEYRERRLRVQHDYGDRVETTFRPAKGSELSNNMTAEGFRKVGILQQLLVNRSLNPGISGPLFWDEPEANMNPKLVRLLVNILLELSRNGQQVILSTHDYIVLKWFDLLMDKGLDDHVRFHSLYHDQESKKILIESTDSYLEIKPNLIAGTFRELTDQEILRSMGVLGK